LLEIIPSECCWVIKTRCDASRLELGSLLTKKTVDRTDNKNKCRLDRRPEDRLCAEALKEEIGRMPMEMSIGSTRRTERVNEQQGSLGATTMRARLSLGRHEEEVPIGSTRNKKTHASI